MIMFEDRLTVCNQGSYTELFTGSDGFILIVAVLSHSQLPQNHLK